MHELIGFNVGEKNEMRWAVPGKFKKKTYYDL